MGRRQIIHMRVHEFRRKGQMKLVVDLILILIVIILSLIFITSRAWDADARARAVLMPCECPDTTSIRIKAMGGFSTELSEADKPLGSSVLEFCNCKKWDIEEKDLTFNLKIFTKAYGTLMDAKLRLPSKFKGVKFKPEEGGYVAIGEMMVTEIMDQSFPEGAVTIDNVNVPMSDYRPQAYINEFLGMPTWRNAMRKGLMSSTNGWVRFDADYDGRPEANTMWNFHYTCLSGCEDMIPACTYALWVGYDPNGDPYKYSLQIAQGCQLDDQTKDPLYVKATDPSNPMRDHNVQSWFCKEGCPPELRMVLTYPNSQSSETRMAGMDYCIIGMCLSQDVGVMSGDMQKSSLVRARGIAWWYCKAPLGASCGFENGVCVKEGDPWPTCTKGMQADCYLSELSWLSDGPGGTTAPDMQCGAPAPDGKAYGWCCPTYDCSLPGAGADLGFGPGSCTIQGPNFVPSLETASQVSCMTSRGRECRMAVDKCVEMVTDQNDPSVRFDDKCAMTPANTDPVTQCTPNTAVTGKPCVCGTILDWYYKKSAGSQLELAHEPQMCKAGQSCCSYSGGMLYVCRDTPCPPQNELHNDYCMPNPKPGKTVPERTTGCWCGLHWCNGTTENEEEAACCPEISSGSAYCAPYKEENGKIVQGCPEYTG